MKNRRWLLALLGSTLGLGCDSTPAPAPQPSAPAPAGEIAQKPKLRANEPAPVAKTPKATRPGPLNVLLLTVDALRHDVTRADYARKLTENISKLAEESVVFENHRSTTSFTAQSVPAILTGRYASTLYRSGFFFAGYAPANEFFTESLQAKEVRTIGLHAHMYFTRGKGLEQGFDVWETVPGITYNEKTDEHVTSEKTTTRLIELLSEPETTDGQFFAWAHYMDPHHGYVNHEGSPVFGKSDRDRYDNEVHHTDRSLGELFAWARKQAWWDKTAVIVTADHGEAFGEHGMNQHAHELWEELVRVPLVMRVPGAEPKRLASAHTHVDLAPTILELMGHDPLASFQGKSLVGELYGDAPAREQVIALELAADNVQEGRRAVIHGKHKLIVWGSGKPYKQALFDLEADPGEKKDLSKSEPELCADMLRELEATFDKLPRVAPYGGMALEGGGKANGPRKPELASL